jgi:hypothetical protein
MIDNYKQLYKDNFDTHLYMDSILVRTYIPNPTDYDYNKSYITRYFTRRVNDLSAVIYEVDVRNVSIFAANPFYIWTQIDWKISKAPIEDVEMMNKKSVLIGQKVIPNLSLYLPNLSQFYKVVDF